MDIEQLLEIGGRFLTGIDQMDNSFFHGVSLQFDSAGSRFSTSAKLVCFIVSMLEMRCVIVPVQMG